MGRSNKGPITPYRGSWADQEFKRRTELMLADAQPIDDAIAIATIRENIRIFGADRVRGL
jgi:hypothetical protein